jgi:predicted esterase
LYSCTGKKPCGELHLVTENPDKGFHFPYYLFVPEGVSFDNEVFLIVEPNNSGFVKDEFNEHLEKAERIASRDFYPGNYLSCNLNYPLLVPVFPRNKSQWQIYTHALDRDVMLQKNTELERIDLQLLAMIDNAREKLREQGLKSSDKILITGFSASASFANRFTALHPERVKAMAAGGLNGLLFIPMEEINGEKLNFPIGTNDFESLFDAPFNRDSFKATPQFLFMGALDDNDAIPYRDAFDINEQDLIFSLLGEEMQPMRWENCQSIYNAQGVNAHFRTYDDVGHQMTEDIKADILEFIKMQL